MTVAERRAALEKNPTAKIIWIVLLVMQALAAVIVVLAILAVTIFATAAGGATAGLLGGFVVLIAVLGLGLSALIFFGILRLEKWIQWLMWINVALSLPSLFSSGRNFFTGLLPILVAVGYTYILREIYPKTPAVPLAPPPTPLDKK